MFLDMFYRVLADCVLSTHGMRSMPTLGGLGACPPENFEKLDPLRLNLRVFLTLIALESIALETLLAGLLAKKALWHCRHYTIIIMTML